MRTPQKLPPTSSEAEAIVVLDKILDHYWRDELRDCVENPHAPEKPHSFCHLQELDRFRDGFTTAFSNGDARNSCFRPPPRRAFCACEHRQTSRPPTPDGSDVFNRDPVTPWLGLAAGRTALIPHRHLQPNPQPSIPMIEP